MKLTDLDPRWCSSGGEGVTRNGQPVPERDGIGVSFDCPCGCDQRCVVLFENPTDGGPRLEGYTKTLWQRTGDTFETLTLTPSILRTPPRGCGWHGFITNGEVISC